MKLTIALLSVLIGVLILSWFGTRQHLSKCMVIDKAQNEIIEAQRRELAALREAVNIYKSTVRTR